jgi:hypothetical protein
MRAILAAAFETWSVEHADRLKRHLLVRTAIDILPLAGEAGEWTREDGEGWTHVMLRLNGVPVVRACEVILEAAEGRVVFHVGVETDERVDVLAPVYAAPRTGWGRGDGPE